MEVIPLPLGHLHWLQKGACNGEKANELVTGGSGKEGERIAVVKGEIAAATLSMRWDDREGSCWQRLSLRIKTT